MVKGNKFYDSDQLVRVYKDTMDRGKVNFEGKSRKFTGCDPSYTPQSRFSTRVIVENIDCLEAVELISDDISNNVCVLNMASDFIPGGGVRKGSRAQEEEICRRTDLLLTLNTFKPTFSPDPYLSDFDCIFSENIRILKNGDYTPIPGSKQHKISFISAAAIRRPVLIDGSYSAKNLQTMRGKIRTIFETASRNNVEHFIVGAWGCGAFSNPPEDVARLFREIIDEYNGVFKTIIFAILERKPPMDLNRVFRRILIE